MARSGSIAIEIEGLNETARAIKNYQAAINESSPQYELKTTHWKVGELVRAGAVKRIHSQSGDLAASYKVRKVKTGATVYSSLVYAGVSEFGGSVYWKPKVGPFSRVPIGGDFRMMGPHRIKVKPTARSKGQKSYYIYPAIEENEDRIRLMYADTLERIRRKHLPNAG